MSKGDRGTPVAPPTRIEDGARGAPASTWEPRETLGAPPTRHEGFDGVGTPPTRHEARGGPAAPRQDGGVRGRTQRLPEELAARFDYLHDLGYGAQATVLLCRQRTDGQLLALKLYHPSLGGFDATTVESLRRTDPAHVAPILDAGLADERLWELQEYYPLGSIRDMVNRDGLPLVPDDVLDFVRDLAAALTHIHERNIVHRDLKPENILVRERSPLDCVIGDFGLARELVLSRQLGSVAGTFPYTAPEGMYGRLSRAGDWWSLGVIAHELLTGHHMFAGPEGGFLAEAEVRAALYEHTWNVTGVTDPRFQRLFDGLIAWQIDERWGATQVADWLAGGEPPVPDPTATAMGDPGSGRRGLARMFFEGESFATPEELAAGFRAHFDAASDMLAGVKLSDLRDWLHQTEVGTDADNLIAETRSGHTPPQRAMVELLNILDPATPPVFQGATLSPDGLADVCRRATADQEGALSTIVDMRQQHILSAAVKRAPDGEDLARVDARLTALWRAAATFLKAATADPGLSPWTKDATRTLEAVFLYAALRGDGGDLVDGARAVAAEGAAESPAVLRNWSNGLRSEDASPAMVAQAAVVMTFTPLVTTAVRAKAAEERAAAAAKVAADQAAAEAALRQEREAARAQRARELAEARRRVLRRLRIRAIVVALILGAVAWWGTTVGMPISFVATTLGIPMLIALVLSVGVDLALPRRADTPLSWMAAVGLVLPEVVSAGAAVSPSLPIPLLVEGVSRVPVQFALGYVAGSLLGALLAALAAPKGKRRNRDVSTWALVLPMLGLMVAMTQIGLNAASVSAESLFPGLPYEVLEVLQTLSSLTALSGVSGVGLSLVRVTAVVSALVLFARSDVRSLSPWLRTFLLLLANILSAVVLSFCASSAIVLGLALGSIALGVAIAGLILAMIFSAISG